MSYKLEINLKTNEETLKLGNIFGKEAFVGEVITLEGQLGAGKTTFSQGFAKGLNLNGIINSPTFNIVKCYFNGNIPFYHIDAYRLEDVNHDLGLEEYIEGDGVCLIEWKRFIEELIPNECLNIEIEILEDSSRKFMLTANGEEYENLLRKVESLWAIS